MSNDLLVTDACGAGSLAWTVPGESGCLRQNLAKAQAALGQLHDLPARHTLLALLVHQHSLSGGWVSLQGIHHGYCCWTAAIELHTCASWPDSGPVAQLPRPVQHLEHIQARHLCCFGC